MRGAGSLVLASGVAVWAGARVANGVSNTIEIIATDVDGIQKDPTTWTCPLDGDTSWEDVAAAMPIPSSSGEVWILFSELTLSETFTGKQLTGRVDPRGAGETVLTQYRVGGDAREKTSSVGPEFSTQAVLQLSEGSYGFAAGPDATLQQIYDNVVDTEARDEEARRGMRIFSKDDPIADLEQAPTGHRVSINLLKSESGEAMFMQYPHVKQLKVRFIEGKKVIDWLADGDTTLEAIPSWIIDRAIGTAEMDYAIGESLRVKGESLSPNIAFNALGLPGEEIWIMITNTGENVLFDLVERTHDKKEYTPFDDNWFRILVTTPDDQFYLDSPLNDGEKKKVLVQLLHRVAHRLHLGKKHGKKQEPTPTAFESLERQIEEVEIENAPKVYSPSTLFSQVPAAAEGETLWLKARYTLAPGVVHSTPSDLRHSRAELGGSGSKPGGQLKFVFDTMTRVADAEGVLYYNGKSDHVVPLEIVQQQPPGDRLPPPLQFKFLSPEAPSGIEPTITMKETALRKWRRGGVRGRRSNGKGGRGRGRRNRAAKGKWRRGAVRRLGPKKKHQRVWAAKTTKKTTTKTKKKLEPEGRS